MPPHLPPTRCRIPTPLRRDLLIIGNGTAILASHFVPARAGREEKPGDALLAQASAQVKAYFARRLRRFDLPLELSGTAFQIEAWRAVAALCFGEFVSYADVARAIGKPLAHRGIAMAMAATTIDLFVPAHRVIGADGLLKGAGPQSIRFHLAEFELAHSPSTPHRPRSRPSLPRTPPDRR